MKTSADRAHMKERGVNGFTLLELMTVVAILGILVAMSVPSMIRMLQRQETKTTATQMAGLLTDARARAVSEGTPHLVYFNPPSVDGNGECGAMAVEVRDADHSYSITAGDDTREFHLSASACKKVTAYGEGESAASEREVPMPMEDLAVRAADASVVAAVGSRAASVVADVGAGVSGVVGGLVGGLTGSDSSGSGEDSSEDNSGPGNSGNSNANAVANASAFKGTAEVRSSTVRETVVNGATFPVDAESGRPVIAFDERGIPVDPADPTSWGSGAGGVYLTDGSSAVYAALVAPLGEIKLRMYDDVTQTWK